MALSSLIHKRHFTGDATAIDPDGTFEKEAIAKIATVAVVSTSKAANVPVTLPADLTDAALAVCRQYGDSEADQALMLEQLAEYPTKSFRALTEHFRIKLTSASCIYCRDSEPIPDFGKFADLTKKNAQGTH